MMTVNEVSKITGVSIRTLHEFMQIFVKFGKLKDMDPVCEEVWLTVKELQDFITEHLYVCSNEILYGLGQMYAGGGEFTENIDKAGGNGTALFTSRAIEIYCGK